MEPQLFGHCHPADLRENDRLAVHLYRVRAVVGPEALLVPSPIELEETDASSRVLAGLFTLRRYSPQPWAAARKDPGARRFLWNLGGPALCWGLRQLAMWLIPRPRMSGDAEVVDEARDADGAAAVAFLLAGLWRVPIPTTE